jgi:hypothetical protein
VEATVRTFIDAAVVLLPQLKATESKLCQQWLPDEPPPTIVLGEFGTQIFLAFENNQIVFLKELLSLIEDAVKDSDRFLSTAVTTGLIEAIVSEADRNPLAWNSLIEQLGPQSARNAIAWKNFGS